MLIERKILVKTVILLVTIMSFLLVYALMKGNENALNIASSVSVITYFIVCLWNLK